MLQRLSVQRRILAVVGGGFCGTIVRVVVSSFIQAWLGKGWPYDILLINITGALLLAFITTLADATILIGPTRRLFINVGVLGAYTTFSSLALGDVLLLAGGHWLSALGYLVVSGLGGIIAIVVGDRLGQWVARLAKRSSRAKTTRKLTGLLTSTPLDATVTEHHVDVQDDLLLPDETGLV